MDGDDGDDLLGDEEDDLSNGPYDDDNGSLVSLAKSLSLHDVPLPVPPGLMTGQRHHGQAGAAVGGLERFWPGAQSALGAGWY